ncbi:hypothetical protein SAY87_016773 [Trapa incisa]|uniref:Subtilisin-like protease SBT1.7 n=1 Tax=Trapa incisa TaxID=236973 RepID=A0AAN7LI98_9MYRT|nr:hypothetical protein SAY87_016773 [Trapa incisa]
MLKRSAFLGSVLWTFLFVGPLLFTAVAAADGIDGSETSRKTYIVHVAKSQMPAVFPHHDNWFDSSLRSVSDSAEVLYTYAAAIHGFSTRLTGSEAVALEAFPGVISVLPEQRYELHTTRTPEFLGIEDNAALLPESGSESDVIVGVLDTGVWPESRSYNDAGLGPVPAGWKGECEAGTNFTAANCNKKLIGARFFSKGYEATMGPIDESKESRSARDDDGHGTHTSSTAAGSEVEGANLFGYALGNARGMARKARVSVYKVCWLGGCFSSDILAAIDRAILDGVNILSLSLGGGSSDFYRDSVAIGTFAATEKGILISCSAGNAGPGSSTLSNVAPWITTVGAGTIDRDFPAYVSLGNGKKYSGVSLYNGTSLPRTLLPFVYAGNASNNTNGNLCFTGTLDPEKVAGKIVLCDRGVTARVLKGQVVKLAGGAGMVLANTAASGEELVADAHLLPATSVGEKTGIEIKKYLLSDPNPTVTILFEGTKVGIQPAPVVSAFSSRGPSTVAPSILKPDIIAPGVNILAGWTGAAGPTGLSTDSRRVDFNIISGTSMSCPHVSGLAAFVKARHSNWSPAAIRSALMTTAYDKGKDGKPLIDVATGKNATPFDFGAGHVDPKAALDPGLVYDLNADDYLNFLCALNYTPMQINLVARRNATCDAGKTYSVTDLNYPSFAAVFDTTQVAGGSSVVKFTRTLTSVSGAGTYKVFISTDSKEVKVSVDPGVLSFGAANEKKSYTVTVIASSGLPGTNSFGRIVWSDGIHTVGSPMAFTWN